MGRLRLASAEPCAGRFPQPTALGRVALGVNPCPVRPPGAGSLQGDLATLFRGELRGARLAALEPADFPQGHGGEVLRRVGWFGPVDDSPAPCGARFA